MNSKKEFEVYSVASSDRLILVGEEYIDYQQGLGDDSYEQLIDNYNNYHYHGRFMYRFFTGIETSLKDGSLIDKIDEFFWMWVQFEEGRRDLNELIESMGG